MRGSRTMARPMATRWRWPPESCLRLALRAAVSIRRISAARFTRCVDLGAWHARGLEAEGEVLVDAHVRIERVALEHHGDAALGGRHLVHALAVDQEVAAGDRLEAGDHAQQRRLAAARGADEDGELAGIDGEVDAVDDLDVAVPLEDLLRGRRSWSCKTLRQPARVFRMLAADREAYLLDASRDEW